MKINAGEIRVGMLIEYKNDLWQVLKTQHVKPGKGGAFAQVEMKSVNKNTKLNERFRSSETVEKASLDETNFSFSYEDQDKYFFMNPKTFEQIEIQKSLIGEKGKLLTENLDVTISFYNDNPISVDLPNQVTCKIDNTDAALKGQTVSSSYKPAILENGLSIQVPPFVEAKDILLSSEPSAAVVSVDFILPTVVSLPPASFIKKSICPPRSVSYTHLTLPTSYAV